MSGAAGVTAPTATEIEKLTAAISDAGAYR